MPSKWTTEVSRILLKDRWITLRADACRRADGLLIDPYYVLERPEWTSVLALTPALQVVTVREYRHGAGVSIPALPSGSLEPHDTNPAAGAARELLEETGYLPGQITSLGAAYANWANQNNKVHYFLATDCTHIAEQTLDHTEEIEVGLFPMHDVMAPGFLQQSFHLANLYLALPHLKQFG